MNASHRPSGNLFSKLADLSFSSFITPQVAKILYILALINMAIGTLNTIRLALYSSYSSLFLDALPAVAISLLNFLVYAIAIRIAIEGILALIRTSENTRILAENILSNQSDRPTQP